ncbi:sterol-binding protein [Ruegeria sp. HKCCD6157]|nr:sterol-binding protein [Ruegeria sp. HKCCD6157]
MAAECEWVCSGGGAHPLAAKETGRIDNRQVPGAGAALGRLHRFTLLRQQEVCLSDPRNPIPRCPAALAAALRFVPLAPLSLSLTAFSRKITKKHPDLLNRLGEYSQAAFVLDPTDLPVVLLLEPNDGAPRIRLSRGHVDGAARISGPLAALLGLVHGAFDGDALFFSRDLVIEGDTAAALALRNAIDDAELDLAHEAAALSGPLARPLKQIIAFAERRTGLCLTRPEDAILW